MAMSPFLRGYVESRSAQVERCLGELLRRRQGQPETLRRAMSYSLFAGGKRLRPILLLAAAESCGGPARKVLKAAAALEMIHTYSLIHDDLPAMDDDDLRRGKPTNHKVFGEAMAILAGDGLLTQAFEAAAASALECGLSARRTADLVRALAQGAGTQGMVGGQAADLLAEGITPHLPHGGASASGTRAGAVIERQWRRRPGPEGLRHAEGAKRRWRSPSPPRGGGEQWGGGLNGARRALRARLQYIHLHKTAALIAASLEAGAILAGGSQQQRMRLRAYGLAVGLAFQIADDILDVVGDKEKLGKKGSDAQNKKLTYVSLYGVEAARRKAKALIRRAHACLGSFGAKARILHDLADYIIAREN